ncbi:MAG: hypothetical protein QOE83_862 [Actinomycetota bacterium]|jgi:hypothetical protein|nr:hypothetical protein [Actinomycetota bacterium]
MDTDTFRRYLQAHAAGADVGLAIARRLAKAHPGTELGRAMEEIAGKVQSERATLQSAIDRLPAKPDLLRRAAGAVGAAGRLAGELPFVPEPSLLEDLEALAVGVWGKRLLWGALRRADLPDGDFSDMDLDGLSAAAEEQEKRIIRLREDYLAHAFAETA